MLTPAEVLQAQLKLGRAAFGPQCQIAGEHYVRQFGIPLNSLALQYIFGVENLPVGRFYGFSGPTESMKSSLVFWLLRSVMAQGGLATLVETERKLSDTLLHGIVGRYINQLLKLEATTLEEAQTMLNKSFAFYKKELPTRHLPYALGWDSIRGVLSEETSKKIDTDGHVTKQFSTEANHISKWFAKMVQELSFWPMVLFFVQHEKTKQQEGYGGGGGEQKTKLGGIAPDYHATVLVRCNKTNKGSKEDAQNAWQEIQMRTTKNNLGLRGRRLLVTMHFQESVSESGQMLLNYFFDWDKADCDILLSDKLSNKSGVKSILNLTEMSQKGYYSCPELGLKKATAKEFNQALRDPSNEELFTALKQQMHIKRNLRFDEVEWVKVGGTDKNPIHDWAVKEGVDVSKVKNVTMEEYEQQQVDDPEVADEPEDS